MEVAQHYSNSNNNDSSEPESSSDFAESPTKNSEFAAAAAAAAAAAMASEDFRSHSIAALRARAQQHSARIEPGPLTPNNLENNWQQIPQKYSKLEQN